MPKVLVVDRERAERAAVRVLVVPHAGAGAAAGTALAQAVPDDWCVGTVRFAGRESRFGEPLGTFEDQLRDVTASAADYPGAGPLIVVGSCSGAVLVVEAARADQGGGASSKISACVLLSRPGPGPDDETDEPEDVSVASLVRMGGLDEQLLCNEEFLDIALRVLKADMAAVNRRSEATPRLTLPLLALRGGSDPYCSADDLRTWAGTADSLLCAEIEGGHFLLDGSADHLAHALVGRASFLLPGRDVVKGAGRRTGATGEGVGDPCRAVQGDARTAQPTN